ncbi:hypothetical protein BDZ94DRAFT_1239712 [Collybia nuda]|uniref:Uncharacterized protein n=1 Tax=Collybia nuda TaxID=64659 RepID=A0A9P5XWC8_9AGAR|nr:hypothetical protein BDZ94DRAFT_1239712 [Collybia nuda]
MPNYDQGQLLLFLPTFVQAALWGIYATLFCLCIYIFQQREGKRQRAFQAVTVTLFLLCTAQCAFSIASQGIVGMGSIKNWLYVVSNFIADLLFVVLTFVNTGVGFFIALKGNNIVGFGTGAFNDNMSKIKPDALQDPQVPFDSRTSLFISLATNATLTVLSGDHTIYLVWISTKLHPSAGHIWWHSRGIRKVLGPKASKKYDTAIALISQGIAPTLIIVRIGLGMNPQDAQTVIQAASQIQFTHGSVGTSLGRSLQSGDVRSHA